MEPGNVGCWSRTTTGFSSAPTRSCGRRESRSAWVGISTPPRSHLFHAWGADWGSDMVGLHELWLFFAIDRALRPSGADHETGCGAVLGAWHPRSCRRPLQAAVPLSAMPCTSLRLTGPCRGRISSCTASTRTSSRSMLPRLLLKCNHPPQTLLASVRFPTLATLVFSPCR